MISDMETAVRRTIGRLLKNPDISDDTIDLDRGLSEHYGMTSMKMVLLMTSLCEEAGISLAAFTERDIVAIRTPRDVIGALTKAARETTA